MRAPTLVLLALSAIALAVVLFLVLDRDLADRPGGQHPVAPLQLADGVSAAAEDQHDGSLSAQREQVEVDPAAEAVKGESPLSGPGLPVTVRVIDGATGDPVPFADVAVMPRPFDWASMSDADREVVRRFGEDRVAMLRHFGRMERADSSGALHLSLVRWLFLACEYGGRYGRLDLRAAAVLGQRDHELKLGPDSNLRVRVRVVGVSGEPLPHVELGVRPLFDDPVRAARQDADFIGARSSTDEEGRATLYHLQEWVKLHRDGAPTRGGLRLMIPGVDKDAYVFDPASPPAETVELRAPPTGEVLMRLVDAAGAPLGTYEDIRLREPESVGGASAALAGGARRRGWSGQPAGEGAARFPYVALGQFFVADATATEEFEEKTIAGPAVAGQVVEVELRVIESGGALFTGRLVDEAGQPLDRMHLDVHFETDRSAGSWRLFGESGGRLRLNFDGDMEGEVLVRAVLQQLVRFEKGLLMGELPFRGPLRRGHHELGDIVMVPAPLIASGKVTVDGARPDVPVAVIVEFRDADGDWRDVPAAAVDFSEPGVFEVRGSSQAERHRAVPASHACTPGAAVEFRLGQRDLALELRRGGSIRVEPLLDQPPLAGQLPFLLTADGQATAAQQGTRRDRSPSDFFEPGDGDRPPALGWRGLAPGAYRLRLMGLAAEPIVDLRGLVVPSGRPCADPRLAPLDLREIVRHIAITVIDGEGRPVGSSAALVWSGSGDQARGAVANAGRVVLPITGPIDLQVAARGHHVQTLHAVDGDRVVRMRVLPTLRIALPSVTAPPGARLFFDAAPKGLPGDEVEVLVDGRRKKMWRYLVPHGPRLPIGAARVVEVPARPGEEMELRVWLQSGDEWALVEGCAPAHTALSAGRGTPVTLHVPAAAVAAAFEKLRR